MKPLHTLTFLFLFVAPAVFAATVEINLPDRVAHDAFGVLRVFLDTEGTSINAVSGELVLPAGLRPWELRTGSSIVSIWIEEPRIDGETIRFAGAIPNGIAHTRAPLFDVVFLANRLIGEGDVAGSVLETFTNDGTGIPVPVTLPETLTWSFATSSEAILVYDDIPPEFFEVIIKRDLQIFDGRAVAIFSAVDKQSGVDYYELLEHADKNDTTGKWTRVRSPALLADQDREMFVSVKAVDYSGNVRVVTIAPERNRAGVFLFAFFGLFFLIFFVYVVLYRRKR